MTVSTLNGFNCKHMNKVTVCHYPIHQVGKIYKGSLSDRKLKVQSSCDYKTKTPGAPDLKQSSHPDNTQNHLSSLSSFHSSWHGEHV